MNAPRTPFTPEIHLGDLARALHALRPADDATREAIANALGMSLGQKPPPQGSKPSPSSAPTVRRSSTPVPRPARLTEHKWGEQRTQPDSRVVGSRLESIQAGRAPRRRAICIGIDSYPGAPDQTLPAAVDEARHWRSILQKLDFKDVMLLTNQQATRAAIVTQAQQAIEELEPDDVLFIQFSGLSAKLEGDKWLFAYDATPGTEMLRLSDLSALASKATPGANITIFLNTAEVQSGVFGIAGLYPARQPHGPAPVIVFSAEIPHRTMAEWEGFGFHPHAFELLSQNPRGFTNASFYQALMERTRALSPFQTGLSCPDSVRQARFLAPPSELPADSFPLSEPETEIQPPSLLRPQWQRGVLSTALATAEEYGPVDVARLVDVVAARRPVRMLPRQVVPTLRRGVQVALDVGRSMLPFLADESELLTELKRVVGTERLEAIRFVGTPLRQWARGEDVWADVAYPPPSAGTPVLVVSDLGIGASVARSVAVTTDDWLLFAAHLKRAGCPLIALVPYAPSRWPRALADRAAILHWDHRTSVGMVRRWIGDNVLRT